MSKLSPQAQAVMDAVNDEAAPLSVQREVALNAAAVLRAAADQVVPEFHDYTHGSISEIRFRGRKDARADLLAIATELEGGG